MMGDLKKLKQLQENPREHEKIRSLAAVLADIEGDTARAIAARNEADDVDDDLAVPDTGADREARMLEIMDVVVSRLPIGEELSLEEVHCKHNTAVDDPEAAARYVGLSREDWRARMGKWADIYRKKAGAPDEVPDAKLADRHVRRKFGVPLGEFVTDVVEADQESAMRSILRRPTDRNLAAIEAPLDDEATRSPTAKGDPVPPSPTDT